MPLNPIDLVISNQGYIGQQIIVSKNLFLNYFILSCEIIENISAIEVVSIYSEMIWYHFTVDWYHHSMQELSFLTILGIVVFRKDFACIVLVCHYTTGVFTSYQATDVTLWRHFIAHITLIFTRRQSNGSFKRPSLIAKFFLFFHLNDILKHFLGANCVYTQYYTQ